MMLRSAISMHSTLLGFLVTAVVIFSGCEESVDIDYSNFDHRLVVFATLSPQEPIRVRVTASQNPIDTLDAFVPEFLHVQLSTHPSHQIQLQQGQDGYFRPAQEIFPLSRTEIVVSASAPGFEDAEVMTRIPHASTLENAQLVEFEKIPSETSDLQTNVNYQLVLYMDHGENRYYHFSFIQAITNRGQDTLLGTPDDTTYAYYLRPNDPLTPGMIHHHETGVLIDAQRYDVNSAYVFNFSDFFFFNEVPEYLYFEIKTVSEDYYNYFSTLSRQLQSRNDPFAEPIPLYTNVKGGTGVLAGYDLRYDRIKLPY